MGWTRIQRQVQIYTYSTVHTACNTVFSPVPCPSAETLSVMIGWLTWMNETSAVSSVKFTLWIGLRCDHSVGFSLDWTVTCVCVSVSVFCFSTEMTDTVQYLGLTLGFTLYFYSCVLLKADLMHAFCMFLVLSTEGMVKLRLGGRMQSVQLFNPSCHTFIRLFTAIPTFPP